MRTYDDWVSADFNGDGTARGANGTGYSITCAGFVDNCYDGENIFDVEAAYTWNDNYTFVLGANNVFDEAGANDVDNFDGTIGSGNAFDGSTPWGIEGAFYYARLRMDF
jgi:iron complex outermembrane receptor protein